MKVLQKIALLGLVAPLLFSLLSFTNAVVGEGKDVITIKVHECYTGCEPRILVITKGQSKKTGLEKEKHDNAPTDRNTVLISNTIEQFIKEGYKVEASHTAVVINEKITTYILTK